MPNPPLKSAMALHRSIVFKLLHDLGSYALFLALALRSVAQASVWRRTVMEQMVRVGWDSLPLVGTAAIFSGVVFTVQAAYQLENMILGPETIGGVVVPTLMLEISALTTALVMASRVGAGITAEIGNMVVTEQVDAIEAMGINSVAYLVLPRIFSGVFMFPVLYTAALAVGTFAGALAGEYLGYLTTQQFIQGARQWFDVFDLFYGMTKSVAFGFIITSIACWEGYYTEGGAQGVGAATTKSVVASCVVVLLADYVLAELLL